MTLASRQSPVGRRWSAAVDRAAWPQHRLGDALVALARAVGLEPRPADLPAPPPLDADQQGAWIESACRHLGVEARRLDVRYGDARALCRRSGGLLIPIAAEDAGEPSARLLRYLVVLKPGVLVAPDLRLVRVPTAAIESAMCQAIAAEPASRADVQLDRAGVPASRRARARDAMVAQQLADARLGAWTMAPPPERPMRQLLRDVQIGRRVAALGAAHGVYLLLWIAAWWLVGAAVLDGRLDRGWLIAWALLLVTLVPLRVAALRMQGRLAVGAGALLKERLLTGAFRLDPDALLREGAGQLLGRVFEADAVETLALGGGFSAIVATLELVAAAIVFAIGYSGWMMLVLAAWSAAAALAGARYFRRAENWTRQRIDMTNAFVERMVGHRTRLAQESPDRWHDVEDQELDRYLHASVARDRAEALLLALIPQGWLVVGLIAIASPFLTGRVAAPALAAGLGGTLLATRAFHRWSAAFWQLIDARIAWRQIEPLMRAATSPRPAGSPAVAIAAPLGQASSDRGGGARAPVGAAPVPVLDAQGLVYRYPDRPEPVLRGCTLRVGPRDRVLLEGSSGGGKSTLVSLLTGVRTPQAGVLLTGGLDRATRGDDGWRRRIAAAPQFHQNHVITGPLAFNLLMGRPGPPTAADEDEARAICEEMGLGLLLARMPGGLQQMVGETGWQLSQGERGRIFMARALLQRADLVVLDESFAALDPETFDATLACVVKRAPALVVVTHR